jgi:hypothetical protein
MLPYLHPLHRLPREVREQVRRRDLQRLREADEDREAGHLQAELQVADVVAREVGGFGERFLRQAAGFAELAEAAAKELRFLHRCISCWRWNKVLQLALDYAFSSIASWKAKQRSL